MLPLARNTERHGRASTHVAPFCAISHPMHPAIPKRHPSRLARGRPVAQQGRLRAQAQAATDTPTPVKDVDHAAAAPSHGREHAAYDYTAHWWPIAFTSDIDPSAPYHFVLLGIPLVVWLDPKVQQWRVFKDACPHRLVPLSEGRVNAQGLLECPYHGWAFGGDGKCEVIPQGAGPSGCSSPRACATAYPCAVRQGLLFVKPQPLPNPMLAAPAAAASDSNVDTADIPIVEQLEQEGWISTDTWRDVPLDWSTTLENVLDSSHVPFTHHKSISNRNDIGDYVMRLTSTITEKGFSGEWPTGPRAGKMGPQRCRFRAPAYMEHFLDGSAKTGTESMVVAYVVPSARGQCRIINRNLVRFNKTKLPAAIFKFVPQFLIHLGTQVALEDDQIFLHYGELQYSQQRADGQTLGQALYMPSQADAYVTGFRRWIDSFGNGGPFGRIDHQYVASLGPRLSKEALLDRYSQHTQNCHQCRRALGRVKQARGIAKGLGWTALGLAVFTAAVAVAGAAGSGGALAAGVAGVGADTAAAGSAALLQGALAFVADGLLALGSAVTGGGGPGAQVLRALLWAAVAALGGFANSALGGLEAKFYTGDYPPPRNLDRS